MDKKRQDRWEVVKVPRSGNYPNPCSVRFGGKELFLLPCIDYAQIGVIEKMLNNVAIPATLR